MGGCCASGIVLAALREVPPEEAALGEPRHSSRLYRVDEHAALLVAGLPADGHELAEWASDVCRRHRRAYGSALGGRALAQKLASHVHAASRSWSKRSYANSLLVATVDGSGGGGGAVEPQLFMVTSDGAWFRYKACAVGLHASEATVLLEQADTEWRGDESAAQVETRLVEIMRNATLGFGPGGATAGAGGTAEGRNGEGGLGGDPDDDPDATPRVLDVGVLRWADDEAGPTAVDDSGGDVEADGREARSSAFVWKTPATRRMTWVASSRVCRLGPSLM